MQIYKNYVLQSIDPTGDLVSLHRELKRLISKAEVIAEAENSGVYESELHSLEFQLNVDEQPALSPGEYAAVAITILILEPTGKLIERVLFDVWEHIIFPRILDWAASRQSQIHTIKSEEITDSFTTERSAIMSKMLTINPSTGKTIGEFDCSAESDIRSAVQRSRRAQREWRTTSPNQRIDLFTCLTQIIESRTEEIITIIGDETGKRRSDAEYEVYDIIDGISHYSRQLQIISTHDHVVPLRFLPHGTKYNTVPEIQLEPHGVVAAIMPWNFPFWIPMVNIIPALLAGNTVIFKPSEYSTLVGKLIYDLFQAAGFPQGVVELLTGADDVGKALVKEDIDFVFFVGSVAAGLDVRANSGMKPIDVELGGNSAAIVCEDAPLDLAVDGIVWGALYNAGQSCSGHKRVFVHKNVADQFIEKVVKKVNSLEPIRDYGPYIRRSAMLNVHEKVQDALHQGAKILSGGHPLENLSNEYKEGYWYAPTVLEYTSDNLNIVCTETFGNVLPIRRVEDEDEAIELTNQTDYGLNNIVWTSDLEKGHSMAGRLECGMVFVNEAELALVAGEYWGGWKNSGLGTHGTKLEKCFRQKLIITYTGSLPHGIGFLINSQRVDPSAE